MVFMGCSACEGAEVDESIKRRPEVDESIKRRPGTVSSRGHCICRGVEVPVMTLMSDQDASFHHSKTAATRRVTQGIFAVSTYTVCTMLHMRPPVILLAQSCSCKNLHGREFRATEATARHIIALRINSRGKTPITCRLPDQSL